MLFLLLATASAANLRSSSRKLVRAAQTEDRIEGQYIVIFRDRVADVHTKMQSLLDRVPGSHTLYEYDDANIKGVALDHVPEVLLSTILDDDDVEFVEEVRTFVRVC